MQGNITIKELKIEIYDRRFGYWLRQTFTIFVLIVLPIALGAIGSYLDSAAMQWAGFILFLIALSGMALNHNKTHRFTNIDEAIAHLQSMKEKSDG